MAKDIKPTENKEEVKKWRFHLSCTKCSFRFSIERDSSDMNKVDITKMKCMECGKPIMWDTSNFPVSTRRSPEIESKMNIEASREALRMANEMKRADAETGEGKMIPVTSTQKGKSFGRTEMLPEKVIKSLEEKVAPVLEEFKE